MLIHILVSKQIGVFTWKMQISKRILFRKVGFVFLITLKSMATLVLLRKLLTGYVRIFLRWAQNEYAASYDAKNIKVPKSPKREVRIYTESEINAIFSSITAESDWLVLRNKCIIALMYDSGLRQAEVCSLRRSKIS